MIKEYSFPVIFHNVVGQVIPQHILERLNNPFLQVDNIVSRRNSVDHRQLSQQSNQANPYGFKSKKKKLVRRSECMKTLNIVAFNPNNAVPTPKFSAQTSEVVQNIPKFRNFLRKKNRNASSFNPMIDRSSFTSEQPQNSRQMKPSIVLNNQGYKYKTQKEKRQMYRIKTELNDYSRLDGILQQKNQDFNGLNSFQRLENTSQFGYQQQSDQDMQKICDKARQLRNILKNKDSFGSSSNCDAISRKANSLQKRNQHKKKTVNFIQKIASQSSSGTNFDMNSKNSAKKTFLSSGSKKTKEIRTGNKNLMKMKSKRLKSRSTHKSMTQWTGKSVVSIKFSRQDDDEQSVPQNKKIKEKSLRSNQSILSSRRNLQFKVYLKKTKTVKFIQHFDKNAKRFHSQHNLEEDSQKQIKRDHKKIPAKKIKDSGKNQKKKQSGSTSNLKFNLGKRVSNRLSMFKKNEPFSMREASFDKYSISEESYLTLDYLKSNTRKSLQSIVKTNLRFKQTINVYDELNNFLYFFQSRDEQLEKQRQTQIVFNKPIVLPDSINHREMNKNRQIFKRQNLIIDLSNNLARNMNRISQKKI